MLGLFRKKKAETQQVTPNLDRSRYRFVRLPSPGAEALVFDAPFQAAEASSALPILKHFKMVGVPIFVPDVYTPVSDPRVLVPVPNIVPASKVVKKDFDA